MYFVVVPLSVLINRIYLGAYEKLFREFKVCSETIIQLQRNSETDRKSLEQVILTLEEKLAAAVLSKDEAQFQVREVQTMNTELRQTIDKLRLQVFNSQF
jgi:hypothetical protein